MLQKSVKCYIVVAMKKYLLGFLLFSLSLCAIELGNEEQQITINNRILARVNNKKISVLDVMKKMEFYLIKHYPELSDSLNTRYQFFSTNWRQILNQMIDNELILADAESAKLKITDSEIREMLYERFGPNIMPTLDTLGVSYEEARHMIYSEMAIQRMTYFRVHSKAFQRIGPNDIKEAYKRYIQDHPPSQQWKYQLLSIRASSQLEGEEIAKSAYQLLAVDKLPLEKVAERLQENVKGKIQLSQEYEVLDKDLSTDHKQVLNTLAAGEFSLPTSQISRFDQSIVHRIFFLKEHKEAKTPTFDEMTDKLHDELIQKEVSKEFPHYLTRLRHRFNIDEKSIEIVPRDFQPFALR